MNKREQEANIHIVLFHVLLISVWLVIVLCYFITMCTAFTVLVLTVTIVLPQLNEKKNFQQIVVYAGVE